MTETRQFGRRRTVPEADTEAPAAPKAKAAKSSKPEPPSSAAAGWGAMEQKAGQAGGDFYLKVTEQETVIKIMDEAPFDNYVAHWVDEIEEGSKSVRCWGDGCPLCAIGDKAKKFSACFNVVSLSDPGNPALLVWEAGVKIARQLKEIAMDAKKGPLNREDLYFTIKKNQKAKAVEYVLERIRARDLEEEKGIEPLDEDTLAKFGPDLRDEPVKECLSADEMKDLVDLLLGD